MYRLFILFAFLYTMPMNVVWCSTCKFLPFESNKPPHETKSLNDKNQYSLPETKSLDSGLDQNTTDQCFSEEKIKADNYANCWKDYLIYSSEVYLKKGSNPHLSYSFRDNDMSVISPDTEDISSHDTSTSIDENESTNSSDEDDSSDNDDSDVFEV